MVVPDALEVGGLGAWAGGADEQVASVLEVERGETWIVGGRGPEHTRIGWEFFGSRVLAEIEGDTPEQAAVLGEMRREKGVVVFIFYGGEGGGVECGGIAGNIVVASEAGSGGEHDGDGRRAGDAELVGVGENLTTLDGDAGAGLEGERAGNAVGGGVFSGEDQGVAAFGAGVGGLERGERNSEIEGGGLLGLPDVASGVADDDDLIDWTGEDLAGVEQLAEAEGGGGDGGIEVELTPVVSGPIAAGQGEKQVAERLVGHLADGAGHEFLLRKILGGLVLTGGEESTDLRQGCACLGVRGIVGAASPKSVLVELEAFVVDAAEDHGAEATIADRQGLHPLAGRALIPKSQ